MHINEDGEDEDENADEDDDVRGGKHDKER
jgi:hypothetical protein